MCRPTKRPKALVPPSGALAFPMSMMKPNIFSNEFGHFVFDLKEDTELLKVKDIGLDEALLACEATEIGTSATVEEDESRPKTFVYTAFEMVSDAKNAAAIGFSEDGQIMEIRSLELLSEKILPSYFRHKNVTSFYRQLNSYGFRTTRSSAPGVVHAFAHELFRMGREDLLSNIFRKKCLKKQVRHAAKKELEIKMNKAKMETSPPSPLSISSGGSSEEIVWLRAAKPAREAPTELEALREAAIKAQEHADALETENRRLRQENEHIIMETDSFIQSANEKIDVHVSLINLLFGAKASIAFSEQSRPFRMGGESILAKISSTTGVSEQISDFESKPTEILFDEDELAILESIFA